MAFLFIPDWIYWSHSLQLLLEKCTLSEQKTHAMYRKSYFEISSHKFLEIFI
jgi:hypothetical protein